MSERFNFSSTKYGPSVRDAVKTQVVSALPPTDRPVVVASTASAAQLTTPCETTISMAALAAFPNISRRLSSGVAFGAGIENLLGMSIRMLGVMTQLPT